VDTSDAARVYALERESFPDPYPTYLLDHLMRNERERFFVAVECGEIVGYSVAAVAGKEGHVISMAVHPSHRRQGIGTDLLSAVVKELAGDGVVGIHLEVRKGNVAAVSFYERMGFRERSQMKGYYADGEDALVMSRTVADSEFPRISRSIVSEAS
jgi:ribosomal-protein-alanine N-acetyltransferase